MQFSPDTIKKIKRNKRFLEKKINLKIAIKGENVEAEGKTENIFVGERVLEALERNFPIKTALLLLDEKYILEDVSIRKIRDKNLKQTKARIIGTRGKTLKYLSELSECHITLHENTVSILGPAEKIKEAVTAVSNLIRGSKQTNVYNFLIRCRKEEIEDLGLKQ